MVHWFDAYFHRLCSKVMTEIYEIGLYNFTMLL